MGKLLIAAITTLTLLTGCAVKADASGSADAVSGSKAAAGEIVTAAKGEYFRGFAGSSKAVIGEHRSIAEALEDNR